MNTLLLKIIRRILPALVLCLAVLPLAGCWDRREVNDVLLVLGAGIDKKKDKIELSVQYIIPRATGGGQQGLAGMGGGGNGAAVSMVQSSTGVTIADAMSKLQKKFSRRIFWGHMKVFIIGEDLAKEGIREHLDFLVRHPEPRLRSYVFVSKGRASDILEVLSPLERYSAEQARELAKFRLGMTVTIKDLLQMLRGEAGAAALPILEETPSKAGEDPEKQPALGLNGTAIFKKDKMIGSIGIEATRGVLWIRNEMIRATVTVEPKEAEGHVSLQLIRSKTELIPEIKDQQWKMTVQSVTEADVLENTTDLNAVDPIVVKLLKKEAEKGLEDRIKKALNQVQKEMKTDVLGFADAFNRKYPKEWEAVKDRWDEVFPNVQVEVKTKVYIRRPGISTVPPAIPKKQVEKKENEMKQKREGGEEK